MKRYFVIFGVVIVLMLFAARKESGRHVDIKKVEHGHIVHLQKEKTTMLRSTSNRTRVEPEENETHEANRIERERLQQVADAEAVAEKLCRKQDEIARKAKEEDDRLEREHQQQVADAETRKR